MGIVNLWPGPGSVVRVVNCNCIGIVTVVVAMSEKSLELHSASLVLVQMRCLRNCTPPAGFRVQGSLCFVPKILFFFFKPGSNFFEGFWHGILFIVTPFMNISRVPTSIVRPGLVGSGCAI